MAKTSASIAELKRGGTWQEVSFESKNVWRKRERERRGCGKRGRKRKDRDRWTTVVQRGNKPKIGHC
jgi:hypothetical protein